MFNRIFILFAFAISSIAWADARPTQKLIPLFPKDSKLPTQTIPGKARVWIFLSAKCPCSHSHIAKLKKTFQSMTHSGIEFYAIHSNQDEDFATAQAYFEQAQLGFPVFSDKEAAFADHWKALKTPHVFVEGPDHSVLYQGGIDDSADATTTDTNFLSVALNEIKESHAVTKPLTRSLGCVISRK